MNRKGSQRKPDLVAAKMGLLDPARPIPDPEVLGAFTEDKQSPKKKRKSPAVPWKKPKDMPKRPLSAYNLFFKAQRALLLGSQNGEVASKPSAVTTEIGTVDSNRSSASGSPTPGIGFANLAKTIAAKWKTLCDSEKSPFVEKAAVDKLRYDEAVAEWRLKTKKQPKLAKPSTDSLKKCPSAPAALSMPTSHSMEPSNSDDTYPAEWFRTGAQRSEHTHSTLDESSSAFNESYSTFSSSQRSLQYPGLQQPEQLSRNLRRSSTSSDRSIVADRPESFHTSLRQRSAGLHFEQTHSGISSSQEPLPIGWAAAVDVELSPRTLGQSVTFPPGLANNRVERLEQHEFACLPVSNQCEDGRSDMRRTSLASYSSSSGPQERDNQMQLWGGHGVEEPCQQLSLLAATSLSSHMTLQDSLLYSIEQSDLRGTEFAGLPRMMRSLSVPMRVSSSQQMAYGVSETSGRRHTLDLPSFQSRQMGPSTHYPMTETSRGGASEYFSPTQEDHAVHGTSLHALTENLDDDTIDFITRVHFS